MGNELMLECQINILSLLLLFDIYELFLYIFYIYIVLQVMIIYFGWGLKVGFAQGAIQAGTATDFIY
jgi:hypothetical protein